MRERKREGWRGRESKVNTGNDGRGEKSRWTEGGWEVGE